MATKKDENVSALLGQLKKTGAKVVRTHGTTKSKVVTASKAKSGAAPQDFGAWVSWTKSF
jgi:hypothetical protein